MSSVLRKMSTALHLFRRTPPRTVCCELRVHRSLSIVAEYADIPLKSPKTQIRLLRLNAGSWDDPSDPVSGTLFRTDLANVPPYEALSYHWGKEPPRNFIKLDGKDVMIRENLEDALRHLRRLNEPRILWVDALCINQDDIIERNAQVAIMHEIYRKAIRTVAWIGDGREDGELALDLLRRHADRKYRMEVQDGTDQRPDEEIHGWDSVRKVLQRPYWRRLWVMQEIALSSAPPSVVCGRSQIGWPKLTKALENNPTAYFVNRLQRIRGATLTFGDRRVRNTSTSIGRHIILLLSHSASFETTDQKDRVYALYGLFKTIGIVGFTPDYSVSLGKVYQQLTEYVLTMKGGLDILELRSHDQNPDLPSWVVDLSKRPPLSFTRSKFTPWQRREYQSSVAIVHSPPSSDQLLKVSGAVVDSISHVEPIPSCLATVFRAAANEPGVRIFGASSLRSDSTEATQYWALNELFSHPRELCHNTIEYLSRWQSVVAHFCNTRTRADVQAPTSWNWERLIGEVPVCSIEHSEPHERKSIQNRQRRVDDHHDFEKNYRDSLNPLLSSLSVMMQGRVCFGTRTGLHGVSLAGVLPGDKIVVFQSTKNVHILRACKSLLDRHRYIGAAIICPSHHDAESGQRIETFYKNVASNQIPEESFILH